MPFPLPNAGAAALSEDDLKAAKDILVARAASAARVPPEKVAPQIVMSGGELVPAYEAAVQGFLEVRSGKLEAVTRPFKEGMELPPAPQVVKEPFDPWSIPAEPPPPGAKAMVLISTTLEKKDCSSCLGKGSASCKPCFAKGTVNCDACMGAGAQQCSICKGTSKIGCPDCEGSGRVKASAPGAVRAACGSCNGMGKFNCTHCAGGKIDCAACGNSGKKACAACGGGGKAVCGICAGAAKVVIGRGFQAETRPVQGAASAAGARVPEGAAALALSEKQPPVVQEYPGEKELAADFAAADAPEALKAVVDQALKRAKPPQFTGKLSRLKLSVALGGAWRVTGAFSGHEFVYWIHPRSKAVVAEKDPLGDISRRSVETAQDALKRGDWEVALDAARETLAMDPNQADARAISRRWRAKLARESILVGAAAGAAGAALLALPILTADKGLHRMGPVVASAAMALAAGLGAAAAFFPVSAHLFPTKKRLSTVGGVAGGAVLALIVLTKVVLGWDPVKSADNRSLAREMKEKFRSGVSAVYYGPDLEALQGLYEKYKDSRADLSEVNKHIEAQQLLKNELDALTREFQAKLDEVLYANMFLPEKRSRIVDIKEHYALRGVDVSPAERALKDIDEKTTRAATSGPRRAGGTISIKPAGRGAARPKAAAARPAAPKKPAAKAPAKKAPAKAAAKAAVKKTAAKPVKRKGFKPNAPPDPKAATKKPRYVVD